MRKPDPVEIVAIFAPAIAQAVAVSLFIATIAIGILIVTGRLPELPA